MNGPLGSSYGGDNGSALLMVVSDHSYPAAHCVNAGARLGLKLLRDTCKTPRDSKDKKENYSNQAVIKVASFASRLWRTINGEHCGTSHSETFGSCAHDTHLRCTLVALWQWLWPKHCFQLMRAQSWHAMEGTPQYHAMGLDKVLKQTAEERDVTEKEDQILKPLADIVENEVKRQHWRGQMAAQAYDYSEKDNKGSQTEINQPLPLVDKNAAWKLGGWIASTAQQRREKNLDGGRAVRKINLHVQSKSNVEG